MEPASCGSQVNGLLTNTVAINTGRLSRSARPSTTQVTMCTGSGVGGMKAMNSPSANARMTLCRWKAQQPRSSTWLLNGFRHQRLSSVWRSDVMRFNHCCMDYGGIPCADIMPFSRIRGSHARRTH